MTPDDIRSAIASNPQSQDMRTYLINQAVQNDMADEVPNGWTVELYNPDDSYDDTEDLIADTYRLNFPPADPYQQNTELVINAHESGGISFALPPSTEPLTKFDIPTADRLIEMMYSIRGMQLGTRPTLGASDSPLLVWDQAQPLLVEPTTGVTYSETDYGAKLLTIPARTEQEDLRITIRPASKFVDDMVEGLSAMAVSAETYGHSQQEIK